MRRGLTQYFIQVHDRAVGANVVGRLARLRTGVLLEYLLIGASGSSLCRPERLDILHIGGWELAVMK